jgi:hypothetical protein
VGRHGRPRARATVARHTVGRPTRSGPAGLLHGQRDQDDPRDGECHCGHVRSGEPLIQQ